MKKVVLLSVLLFFYSCEDVGKRPDGGGPAKTIKVEDSGTGQSKVSLGYAVNISESSLTIQSGKGYLYDLRWDGKLVSGAVYYTGANGTGTPFIIDASKLVNSLGLGSFSSSAPPSYGKTIIAANKKLYTYRDVTGGYATPSPISGYKSQAVGDKVSAPSLTFNAITSGYVLEEISYTNAGVPTPGSVILPILFKYS